MAEVLQQQQLHSYPEDAFEAVVAAARSLVAAGGNEDDRTNHPLEVALQQAHDLVRTESPPQQFLQLCHGNVEDAATRLLTYWVKRHETFGDDRYLLPLFNLSGGTTGALSEDDIATLRTGFLRHLPNDSHNRNVLFLDNSISGPLLEGRTRREVRLRCLFYLASAATTAVESSTALDDRDSNEQEEEDVLFLRPLVLVRYSRSPKMYLGKAGRVLSLLEALPRKIEQFWNVYDPPPGARRMFQDTVVPLFEDFPGKERYQNILQSYVASSPDDLHRWLRDRGLNPEHLPPSAGGSFPKAHHMRWLEERLQEDRSSNEGTIAPPMRPSVAAAGSSPPNARKRSHNQVDRCDNVRSTAVAAAAAAADVQQLVARMERRRQSDLVYSRNRRQRVRQEERRLQTECYQLSRESKVLRHEGERLLRLLDEATAMVWGLEQQQQQQQQQQVAVAASAAVAAAALASSANVSQLHPSVEALRLLLLNHAQSASTVPLLSPTTTALTPVTLGSPLRPHSAATPVSIGQLAHWPMPQPESVQAPLPSTFLGTVLGASAAQQQQQHLLAALLAGRGTLAVETTGSPNQGILSLLGLASDASSARNP